MADPDTERAARPMRVHGVEITPEQIEAGLAAMKPGKGIDYWELCDVARALERAGVNRIRQIGQWVAAFSEIVAGRLLQRERRAGMIRHRGNSQWERTDAS